MRHARMTAVLVCALALISAGALAAPPAAASKAVPRNKQVQKLERTRAGESRAARAVAKKRPKARSVNRCVSLAQETSGQTLDLSLTNSCGAGLSCSLGWVVRCGQARDTTTHRGAESVWLSEGSSQTVTASAAECGGKGWRINAIRWSCSRD